MKMNKYQKAFNTIWNTLVYYMVRRDKSLLPNGMIHGLNVMRGMFLIPVMNYTNV